MADRTAPTSPAERFHGEFHHTLDPKGRMILPARYRDRFVDGLRITRGHDHALQVWTLEDYDRTVESLSSLPEGSRRGRQRRRMFMSAHVDTPDSQGRVGIPPPLRDYAELDRELAVVGNFDHLEIWDRANWQDYVEAAEDVLGSGDDDDLGI